MISRGYRSARRTLFAAFLGAFLATIVARPAAAQSDERTINYETTATAYAVTGGTHGSFDQLEASGGSCASFQAAGPGSTVTYAVPNVRATTYEVIIRAKKLNNRGKITLAVSGTPNGTYEAHPVAATTWDLFAPSEEYTELTSPRFSITFGSAGTKYFRFTVTGKNAQSSGYAVTIDSIKLVPQYEWDAPALTIPIVLAIKDGSVESLTPGAAAPQYGPTTYMTLTSGQDYVLLLPGGRWRDESGAEYVNSQTAALQRKGGVRVQKGRNILVLGGGPNSGGIVHEGDYGTGAEADTTTVFSPDANRRDIIMRGIYFMDWTGKLDIRDLFVGGSCLFEGADFKNSNPSATLQIQRVRFAGQRVVVFPDGKHDGGDILQLWQGPDGEVRIADLTLEADNFQGFWLQPESVKSNNNPVVPDRLTIKRVNIKQINSLPDSRFWCIFGITSPGADAAGQVVPRFPTYLDDVWVPALTPRTNTAGTHYWIANRDPLGCFVPRPPELDPSPTHYNSLYPWDNIGPAGHPPGDLLAPYLVADKSSYTGNGQQASITAPYWVSSVVNAPANPAASPERAFIYWLPAAAITGRINFGPMPLSIDYAARMMPPP